MSESCPTLLVERPIPDANVLSNQDLRFAGAGSFDDAVACMEEAVKMQPESEKAVNNLANMLFCQGSHETALALYRKAVSLNPEFIEGYLGAANCLKALGLFEEAVSVCQEAVEREPQHAGAQNALGAALKDLGKVAEAVCAYERALGLDPNFVEAHNNLGVALSALQRWEDAVASFSECLRLRPDYQPAQYNLGLAFLRRELWDEAALALQQAVHLRPNHPEAWYCLGNALAEKGRAQQAAHCYERAIALEPNYAKAHWGLAFCLLQQGDYERGWHEYEWRRQFENLAGRDFRQPLWDGSPLVGRTILLRGEQGLGDIIQFVRYAAVVKRCGGKVVLECPKCLLPLLSNCPGIDALIPAGSELPPFDVHAPLMSLPGILKTRLPAVPAEVPNVSVPSELVGKWQADLQGYAGFRIGIAWQGKPCFPRDHLRSIPLKEFAPIVCLEGVTVFSLPKDTAQSN